MLAAARSVTGGPGWCPQRSDRREAGRVTGAGTPPCDDAARPPVSDPSGASRPVGPARRLLLLVSALVVLLAAGAVGYRVGRSAPSADGPPPVPSTLKAQPVDVGFAMDMIDHHDQAVQMALLALNGATTQPVRSLATSIVADQRREMGILESPRDDNELKLMQGALCNECGNHTVIRKDGCDFCTDCGYTGVCG